MKNKAVFYLFFFLMCRGLFAADEPVWRADGDSITSKILFGSIVKSMQSVAGEEGKIKSAVLKKTSETEIEANVEYEILSPQFRGTVCSIDLTIEIILISMESSILKVNHSVVNVCKSGRGNGMDSIVRAAASSTLRQMSGRIEVELTNSVQEMIESFSGILKKSSDRNVRIKHAVFDDGLSLFFYTGNFTDLLITRNLVISNRSECMEFSRLSAYEYRQSAAAESDNFRFVLDNGRVVKTEFFVNISSPALEKNEKSDVIKYKNEFVWKKSIQDVKNQWMDFQLLPAPAESIDAKPCVSYRTQMPSSGSMILLIR